MQSGQKADAVVIFDANIPKPRIKNHITPEIFCESLCFDIPLNALLNLPANHLKAADDVILSWIIEDVIATRDLHKLDLPVRYYFFITKDKTFEINSGFDSVRNRLAGIDAEIKIIHVPTKDGRGRDLRREEILKIAINKLNQKWTELSPK